MHYGHTYLAASIRSVIDYISEYHVLYASEPSHGSTTYLPCPERGDDLRDIAQAAAGNKLHWHEGNWTHEGLQRNAIYEFAPDADVIITVDADEIYTDKTWAMIDSERDYKGRSIKIPFRHYWRAFHRAIIDDVAAPDRVIFPKGRADLHLTAGLDVAIQHMGYCQPADITRYKSLIHGHRGDWRADWFDTKFVPNAQIDVHPTNHNYWNAVEVDPFEGLPTWMADHSNAFKALVE